MGVGWRRGEKGGRGLEAVIIFLNSTKLGRAESMHGLSPESRYASSVRAESSCGHNPLFIRLFESEK